MDDQLQLTFADGEIEAHKFVDIAQASNYLSDYYQPFWSAYVQNLL